MLDPQFMPQECTEEFCPLKVPQISKWNQMKNIIKRAELYGLLEEIEELEARD
jgi:hypothetical protein